MATDKPAARYTLILTTGEVSSHAAKAGAVKAGEAARTSGAGYLIRTPAGATTSSVPDSAGVYVAPAAAIVAPDSERKDEAAGDLHTCPACHTEKPDTSFPTGKPGVRSYTECRACRAARKKAAKEVSQAS